MAADTPNKGPGDEDSGTYELDLSDDPTSEMDVDDVMRDALAAVQAAEEKKQKTTVPFGTRFGK